MIKNAKSLMDKSKNLAIENNVTTNEILQSFMFERILERLSNSKYKNNFVLKGGLLLSSIMGINNRTTMDMDTIQKLLKKMMNTGGYKYKIVAKFDGLLVNLSVDIATGDLITPRAMEYGYKMLFEDKELKIITYNIETMIAEKLQTLVSRGTFNGRMKDYYDLYYLLTFKKDNIAKENLNLAIERTFEKRDTDTNLIVPIIEEIEKSEFTRKMWDNYANKHKYAKDIEFKEIINTIKSEIKV